MGAAEVWLVLGAAGLLGVPGTILGWVGLGSLRDGPAMTARKPLALFAALAWPVLVLLAVAVLPPLTVLVPTDPGVSLRVLGLLWPVAGLALIAWAVRATARWAGGASPAGTPGRSWSWGSLALLAALALALGVAVSGLGRRLQGGPARGSAPIRTVGASVAVDAGVDLDLSVPPRETFIVSGVVLSNGVPVDAGELRAKLWPPGTQSASPYRLRWQPLTIATGDTASAPWELVVEDETSQTIAARLRPRALPGLDWVLSPAVHGIRGKKVGREVQVVEVARALGTAGTANPGAVDWSLRVQLQSSPVPPGTARRGVDLDFVLPANQAATFELVTQSKGRVTPVPKIAACFVNHADEPYTGKFLLADDPDDLDSLTGVPRWQFGIIGPGERMIETGAPPLIPIPDDLAGNRPWSLASWQRLEPDTEVIAGGAAPDAPGASYALRIRTATIVGKPGVRQQVAGFGTNWSRVVPPAVAPAPVRGVQVSLGVPRGHGALVEILRSTREGIVPLEGSAGYLLASAERDASAVFGWSPVPAAPEEGGRTVPWQVAFRGERGVLMASATNLAVPVEIAGVVPGGGATIDTGWLEPGAESVHWVVERTGPGSDRPGLGVRLRTFPHGLGVVELPERGFAGTGTNWAAEFPASIRTPPPATRYTEIVPQPSAAPDRQSALFRIPGGLKATFEVWPATDEPRPVQPNREFTLTTASNTLRVVRLDWSARAVDERNPAAVRPREVVFRDEASGQELQRFTSTELGPVGWTPLAVEAARVREQDGHELQLMSGLSPKGADGAQPSWRLKLYYGAQPHSPP
ncbi:MAG: hypothetical protein IPH09_12555 [bacterium]|nr:hypothetical protein [bacterium]